MLFVNSLVARFFTTQQDQTATTAMGLVFRLDTMALFVAMGWGTAAQTFVGQNLGARKSARAKRSGWITMGYDGDHQRRCSSRAVFAYGEAILRVFDDDDVPVAIALSYLHVVAPSYLALGARHRARQRDGGRGRDAHDVRDRRRVVILALAGPAVHRRGRS